MSFHSRHDSNRNHSYCNKTISRITSKTHHKNNTRTYSPRSRQRTHYKQIATHHTDVTVTVITTVTITPPSRSRHDHTTNKSYTHHKHTTSTHHEQGHAHTASTSRTHHKNTMSHKQIMHTPQTHHDHTPRAGARAHHK